MTLVEHYLMQVHGNERWMEWQEDYRDHADVLGEIVTASADLFYHPPAWLDNTWRGRLRGRRLYEPAYAFWIAVMPHADLVELLGADGLIREAVGAPNPGRLVGTRIGDLDPKAKYAMSWLEYG